MAKSNTAVAPSRVPRPKSAAFFVRRERNIAEAAQRLERLQARQKLVNQLRKLGYKGTDDQIVTQFNEAEKLARAKWYVDNVLATPVAGQVITRWLKSRILQGPLFVQSLIVKFLDRDGSKDGEKDNSELRRMVEDHLESLAESSVDNPLKRAA